MALLTGLAALPGVTGALSAVSTGLAAIGTLGAARSQASAAEYNARVAERDKQVASQNRVIALQQSQQEVEDKRREKRRTLAAIRAQYGASGFSTAGSPLDVLYDSATELEQDVQRTEYQGRTQERSFALQMLGFDDEVALSRNNARSARRSGTVSFLGAGVSGVGRQLSRVA